MSFYKACSAKPIKRKMSWGETFVALLKGYCAITILVMPKGFQTGGWAAASVFEAVAAVLTIICAVKLISVGLKEGVYSYSLIAEKAFGSKGRAFLDIMIASTQFSFTISYFSFIVQSMKSTIDTAWQINSNPLVYALGIIVVLSPLAWERNIAKFAFTFLIGVCLLALATIVVAVYASDKIMADGLGPDIRAYRPEGALTFLGMAIYSFEGIGIVMPVMHACACPE